MISLGQLRLNKFNKGSNNKFGTEVYFLFETNEINYIIEQNLFNFMVYRDEPISLVSSSGYGVSLGSYLDKYGKVYERIKLSELGEKYMQEHSVCNYIKCIKECGASNACGKVSHLFSNSKDVDRVKSFLFRNRITRCRDCRIDETKIAETTLKKVVDKEM